MIINASEYGGGAQGRLAFFKDLYEHARSAAEEIHEQMRVHLAQYRGSPDIDGSPVQADVVRNVTYELIESQVGSSTPTPGVTPKRWSEKNERNAKSIERLLNVKRNELPFERENDMDERYTPIYGGSVWLVEWDDSVVGYDSVGDVKISCISPLDFIGQPYVYRVEDMEYCFVKLSTTKEDIVRKYGVSIEEAQTTENEDAAQDDDTSTVIVCYYRDEDGSICQYIWSADTELLHLEDYYSRKVKVCRKCGKKEPLCECEKPKLELMTEDYEELDRDIALSDGGVIPARSPKIKDGVVVTEKKKVPATDPVTGQVIIANINGVNAPQMIEADVPVTVPTKLPYYRPKTFPIVIRKNTSEERSLFGQSDCYYIRPQQQAINKIESRIMQKLVRAGITPVMPEDASITVNNSVFGQVVKMKPGESMSQYGKIDTTPDISRDLAEAERLYDQAKRILGISDSFQGQYDGSAQSGYAKQLQINQAAGRLQSKRKMKCAAYADIDRAIFEYYLAYADEPRPAAYIDEYGRLQNNEFNRYDFLEMDMDTGEYYYNDEYLFKTDESIEIEGNRERLWEEILKNLSAGAFGNPQTPEALHRYWMNLERAHYPYAHENVEYFRALVQQQKQLDAQNSAAMAQMPATNTTGGMI